MILGSFWRWSLTIREGTFIKTHMVLLKQTRSGGVDMDTVMSVRKYQTSDQIKRFQDQTLQTEYHHSVWS